tara:strand:+ start:42 stop:1367 length:1326 start_codon:yes stop_codon:yes gene_type:complete
MRVEGKSSDVIIDSITTTNKFKDLIGYLESLHKRNFSDEQIEDSLKHIRNRKRFTKILKNYDHLDQFVKSFEDNSFENIEEVISTYVNLSKTIQKSISEDSQKDSIDQTSFLNLASDDFNPVLDQIELNYSGVNSISSGFNELDDVICKGFQPRRLYTFGGCSGDGKSTLLINFIKNALIKRNNKKDESIFIYVTLENLLDESTLRLYCCIENKNSFQVLRNYSEERKKIKETIKNLTSKNNVNICMQYFPATKITVFDIAQIIGDIKSQYKGKGIIKGVFIDYLDLIKSGSDFDMYRLEIGQVALELKVLAVMLNIPFVTVTQLNRGAYNTGEKLNLSQMGESMKKVDHSDFIGFLRSIEDEKTIDGLSKLQISILKNRMGPKNKSIILKTDFSKFQVKSCTNDSVMEFENITVFDAEKEDTNMKLPVLKKPEIKDESFV